MGFFHCLGRAILYVFVIFAGCLWTVTCVVLIMAVYCLIGFCKNCAEDRAGGCHDLPLMCEGIEKSIEYSRKGWKELWKLVETSRPHDEESRPTASVVPPELATPSPVRLRPERHVWMPMNHLNDGIMGPSLGEI